MLDYNVTTYAESLVKRQMCFYAFSFSSYYPLTLYVILYVSCKKRHLSPCFSLCSHILWNGRTLWMPTATTKSLRLYAYALKPFGLGLPPFSSAVMLCRSLVNQKRYQMQASSELCSSTSLNETLSVLGP